jgi:hypothetical protein
MTAREVVASERRRLGRVELAATIASILALSLTAVGAGALLLRDSRWLLLPRALPFLVWLVVMAGASLVVWRAARRFAMQASMGGVASSIEAEQALRPGELRAVIEVGSDSPFGRRAAERLADRLPAERALAPAMHRRAGRRLARALLAAGAAAAIFAVIVPAARDGLHAVLLPGEAWRGTLLPPLSFDGLPRELLRGESLTVAVSAPGRSRVELAVRMTGESWRRVQAEVDRKSGRATIPIGVVRADLDIVASDSRTMTDTMHVRTTSRPFVAVTNLRMIPPAYLGRPAEMAEWGGELQVPRGARIEVSGRASLELSRVNVVDGADTVPLGADRHTFAGSVQPARPGVWRLEASGPAGVIADVPPPMTVNVVADSLPQVRLVAPAADTLVAADDRLMLRYVASDDHGLASIIVRTERRQAGRSAEAPSLGVVQRDAGVVTEGQTEVGIAALRLQPGDRVTLSVIARDNSPWAQQSESRRIQVRVPTAEERRSQSRLLADSIAAEAVSLAEAQRQLARRTEDASRAQDRSQERGSEAASPQGNESSMSYEASERARAAARAQQELSEKVSELSSAAASLERQLRAAGAMDEALAQQLAEAQRLLREALSPELTAQMQKLQDAAQKLQGREAREAMRDLAEQQRRLREQLEKSAEMLKRAALEGAMQTLAAEAKDIAKEERTLEAAQRGDSARAPEQRELAERTRRFESDARQVAKRLEEQRADAGARGAERSRQHAERSRQQLSSDAGQAAESMEKAAEAMQKARESQVAEWKEELTGELDRAIQELIQLARQEREVEAKTRDGGTPQEQLRGEQGSIQQGLDKAAERLAEAARKSSLLSSRSQQAMREAQQKAENAGRRLGDQRQRSAASQAMGDAAESMGRAAASLARDRERANESSSATGFAEMMQQMQQMAQRQGSIASQAQGLLSMPSSQRESEAGQGSARALARQQRSLSRQLEEIGEQVGGQRAAELGREARQLAELLERGRLDPETVARQQQLFRRMLDAGRSLEKEEREQSDRREARAANDPAVHGPGGAEARGRDAQRFREPTWNELRGLSPEERRAIQEYFRRINGR